MLTASPENQKDQYNEPNRLQRSPKFQVDDWAWLRQPAVRRGCTAKLFRPWSVPYQVKEVRENAVLVLRKLHGRRDITAHYNRLKPFYQ